MIIDRIGHTLDAARRELFQLESAGPGQHPLTVRRIRELKTMIAALEKNRNED